MQKNADFKDMQALTKPRDLAWENWAKFEKEGDSVQGYIVDVFYRPAEGEFKAQRGITLKQLDGKLVNVAIKRVSFVLAKTDDMRLGDPLKIVYEKTMQPRQKGHKGAKVFGFYGKALEENATAKTVAQLELEDMNRGGTAPAPAPSEADDDFESL
jgi:hypothetical protein